MAGLLAGAAWAVIFLLVAPQLSGVEHWQWWVLMLTNGLIFAAGRVL